MAVRTFCDVCDEHIKKDDRVGSVNVSMTPDNYGRTDILVGADYLKTSRTMNHVCSKCFTDVLKTLLK